MAQIAGRNATVVIWDNAGACQNLSGDMNNVVLTFPKDNPESTTFGKDTKQKLSSLRDTTLVGSGIWNGGGSLVDKTLSGISSASQNTLIKFMPSGSGVAGPMYSACMQLQSYAITGPLNSAVAVSYNFQGSSGSVSSLTQYQDKIISLFGSNIVGYWPMNESAGAISKDIGARGHNGAYTAVTLGAAGIGDGSTAASFDGSTSFNNIYSSGLNTDFNTQEGTLAIWCKASGSGVWIDATFRSLINFGVDLTTYAGIRKSSVNNNTDCSYNAGGVGIGITLTTSLTGYFHIAMTWSKSGDAVIAYLNGVQQGLPVNGLGVWSGALGSDSVLIGAQKTDPIRIWSGLLAHGLLLNRAATSTEVAALATI